MRGGGTERRNRTWRIGSQPTGTRHTAGQSRTEECTTDRLQAHTNTTTPTSPHSTALHLAQAFPSPPLPSLSLTLSHTQSHTLSPFPAASSR